MKENSSTISSIRKGYDKESIDKKTQIISKNLGISLNCIADFSQDPKNFHGNIENPIGIVQIPLGLAGPLNIQGQHANGNFLVPMATTEGAMVLSYHMGMKLLNLSGGANTTIVSNKIHISPFFFVDDTEKKEKILNFIKKESKQIIQITEATSSHIRLIEIQPIPLESYLILKFVYYTFDAQGLNMINHATREACEFINRNVNLKYYLRSHYSGIKHFSRLNKETGLGRKVIAQAIIPASVLAKLKVTATEMKKFFDACITIGHAAGIPAVNVHAANAITAIFIACGQDVADISTSHVCSTRGEALNDDKDFFIETTLYNLIVGTVGGGTGLGTQKECLKIMGCYGTGKADKFAEVIAATVLAGEFVTAAAVMNDTYVQAHNKFGRNKNKIAEE